MPTGKVAPSPSTCSWCAILCFFLFISRKNYSKNLHTLTVTPRYDTTWQARLYMGCGTFQPIGFIQNRCSVATRPAVRETPEEQFTQPGSSWIIFATRNVCVRSQKEGKRGSPREIHKRNAVIASTMLWPRTRSSTMEILPSA